MADVEDLEAEVELRHRCDLCSQAFFLDFSERTDNHGAYSGPKPPDRWKSLASRFGDQADQFLRFCEPLSFGPNWLVHPSRKRYYTYFDVNISDLEEWARQDCLFSRHLLRCLEDSGAVIDETHVLGAKSIVMSPHPFPLSHIHFVVFDLSTWRELHGFGLFKNVTLFKYTVAETANTQGTAFDGNACSGARRRNRTPSSRASMRKARHWMETCISTHPTCPKPGGFLPTRVLELSSTPTGPRALVKETMHDVKSVHYAALSYCWGGNQSLLLTSDTVDELSFKGISQEHLPRTIADAIAVAISLGIRYLWVDALCILQDSEEDKAREIAKVAMVYSNATVTMAISRASSVNEGFLSDRFPVEHTAVIELVVSESQPGSTKTVLLVPQEPDETHLLTVMDHNPLSQRAWTFQERLLSPRVLDYGDVQTRWWCPEVMRTKDAPESTVWTDGWEYPEEGDTGQLDTVARVMEGWKICEVVPLGGVTSGQRQNDSADEAELCKRWKTIVDHYSGRQLTFSSDRLPAISAIARSFQRLSGYRYVAGLWAEMMPSALLWRRKSYTTQSRASAGAYWGPTWSWASMDGPMELLGSSSHDTWWTEVTRQFQCDVVGWEVEPLHKQTGGDEFGALKSAVLILSGHARPAYWRRSTQDGPRERYGGENWYAHFDACLYITGRTGAEESLLCKVRFDTLIPGFGGVEHRAMDEKHQSVRDLDLFFLVIANMCERNKLEYTLPSSVPVEKRWQEGLVLRKPASSEYCRIGTFQSEAEAIFSRPGPETDSIHRLQQKWMLEGPREIMRLV